MDHFVLFGAFVPLDDLVPLDDFVLFRHGPNATRIPADGPARPEVAA